MSTKLYFNNPLKIKTFDTLGTEELEIAVNLTRPG